MSDTVRLAWTTDDYDVFTFRVATPGESPTIEVDGDLWHTMAMLRLNLQQLEAPLVAQAREAERAWLDSRPAESMFTPAIRDLMTSALVADLSRNLQFAASVNRQCPDAKGGLTIDVRLPERYRT